MALQARAEATRQRIIDSAVDLFGEKGYGETGLADVLQRAGVSKGAFYYHFDSKEAVAAAIIEAYSKKLITDARDHIDPADPALEGIIRASFSSADIIENDKTARIGNELMQGLTQISDTAARVYREWTNGYIALLTKALAAWDLRGGVTASELAENIWTGILGTHLLSSAMGDDRMARLARAWRTAMAGSAPEDSLRSLHDVLDDAVDRYRVSVQPVILGQPLAASSS